VGGGGGQGLSSVRRGAPACPQRVSPILASILRAGPPAASSHRESRHSCHLLFPSSAQPPTPQDQAVDPCEGDVGEADLEAGTHLPSLRLHSSSSGAAGAEDPPFAGHLGAGGGWCGGPGPGGVPLDEIALMHAARSAAGSRGGTPRAASLDGSRSAAAAFCGGGAPSLSRASSCASSVLGGGLQAERGLQEQQLTAQQQQQKRPQQEEPGERPPQPQQHAPATPTLQPLPPPRDPRRSSGLSGAGDTPRTPPGSRGGGDERSPSAAWAGGASPGSLYQTAVSGTGANVFLPNAAVTELPAAQRGAAWDADADAPVAPRGAAGAKAKAAAAAGSLPSVPSLLGRSAVADAPAAAAARPRWALWACCSRPVVVGEGGGDGGGDVGP
jgi:hypothetical protein